MPYPSPYIVEPETGYPHTHTVILLHGRSSTAQEFATDIFSLKTSTPDQKWRSTFPGIRWVFPDAGQRWCTPFKEERSAWFDTYSLDDLSMRQDLQVSGLRDGIHLVKDIIEAEVERLAGQADRIILGGFSQGSAIALWSLFTGAAMTKGPLGAFVGLSAWMPFTKKAKEVFHAGESGEAQACQIHGLMDTFCEILGIGPLASAEAAQDKLRRMPVYLGHGTDVIKVLPATLDSLTDVLFLSRTRL
ncbi:alpha/beta-hydrolase [Trematosphaeria pertusa]|uniref:Alpha/beta-hydrolase n=1 Tax=Trematosphaeria pertusa TaxID=390896 RepID=A0A6A6J370_9PLEO|nr:alpha/beta-hydrolase [Trematosphaeria pertusa]KAF2257076.1 alpha/beta-hydrolase [Trematosphaeria pertusa]